MNNFVKKIVDLFKSNIDAAKLNNNESDLTTAFKSMELENKKAEEQYRQKNFSDKKND